MDNKMDDQITRIRKSLEAVNVLMRSIKDGVTAANEYYKDDEDLVLVDGEPWEDDMNWDKPAKLMISEGKVLPFKRKDV